MIISASRRTDIPAFYSEWFMNRIREGFLCTRNPFNANQIQRVSLSPADVEAIVFWTRNPKQLVPHLGELKNMGHNCCFLFTITGYPRALEKKVPRPQDAIEIFINLSKQIGPEKVVWRYDPVLISSLVTLEDHKRIFGKIASALGGHTNRLIISFADIYKKVKSNLDKFAKTNSVVVSDLTKDMDSLLELSHYFAKTADAHGMQIQSCAEEIDLDAVGISHGKCIDDIWLNQIFQTRFPHAKDKGQRDECGCIKSTDIGMYNTCLHGCEYCYATYSEKSVSNNMLKHDPNSPFLIGPADNQDIPPLKPEKKSQLDLFNHDKS
ncbi:MAG: DUF1848 domain-containing protein [Desulfuromonadales bacterium]